MSSQSFGLSKKSYVAWHFPFFWLELVRMTYSIVFPIWKEKIRGRKEKWTTFIRDSWNIWGAEIFLAQKHKTWPWHESKLWQHWFGYSRTRDIKVYEFLIVDCGNCYLSELVYIGANNWNMTFDNFFEWLRQMPKRFFHTETEISGSFDLHFVFQNKTGQCIVKVMEI